MNIVILTESEKVELVKPCVEHGCLNPPDCHCKRYKLMGVLERVRTIYKNQGKPVAEDK